MRFGLEEAIIVAVEAHRGQKDWAGWPYITHPLRVMQRMESEHAKILGILHDVIEDTSVTMKDLAAKGASEQIRFNLGLLTRDHRYPIGTTAGEEAYRAYIERIALAPNRPEVRQVKIADLEDNISLLRMPRAVNEKDVARLALYYESWCLLKRAENSSFTVKVSP